MKRLVEIIRKENDGLIEYPILPNNDRGWISLEWEGLSIWETGKEGKLLKKMVDAVNKAQDFICMQTFLMEDMELIEALCKARERGVRVFVLTSVETRIKDTIEEEPEWDTKAKEAYIKLLEEKVKNRFLLRSSPYFHAKYLLIDPKTNPNGFLCTNNFTKRAFLENIELAVQLTPEQVKELFKIFVYHFWEHAEEEHTSKREFSKVEPAKRFSPPELRHILLTSPKAELSNLKSTLIEAIRRAEASISLSTFQLDKNHSLIQVLLREKVRSGVKVKLFTWPMEKYFEAHLKELVREGVEVFLTPRTHAKSLLIDEREGYLFTANLKEEGLDKGMEVGLRLNEKQSQDLARIHARWTQDFEKKVSRQVRAKDIDKYYVFKEERLTEIRLTAESREEPPKKINSVAELCSWFEQAQKFEPDRNKHRSLEVKLIAEIPELPKHIEIIPSRGGFEVVEIQEKQEDKTQEEKKDDKKGAGKEVEGKQKLSQVEGQAQAEGKQGEKKDKKERKPPKKERFVVIYEDFNLRESIEELRKYRDLRIYSYGKS